MSSPDLIPSASRDGRREGTDGPRGGPQPFAAGGNDKTASNLDRSDELQRKLARHGWPADQIKTVSREVTEHWEDLVAEGHEQGLDAAAAAKFADERLGDPAALAQQFTETMRRASWWGRHPVVSFMALPPVTLLVWFMAGILMAMGLAATARLMIPGLPRLTDSHPDLLAAVYLVYYSGVIGVPVFYWWRARRSYCASKWGWWACGACAIHGWFSHVALRPHALSWTYGATMPADWLPVLAPLAVGGVAHWREQRRRAVLLKGKAGPTVATVLIVGAFLLAASGLVTGCASPKVPQQRGWIGGEFKKARAANPLTTSAIVPAFPRQLKGGPSAGILVTGLRSNTPSYRSGLREGDLILRVGEQSVESLSAFRKLIDATAPGTTLSLTLFRDDETRQQPVIVGRETFERWHSLSVGLMLSHEWDLWPDDQFSLIALGYKREQKRAELDSPEVRFIRRAQTTRTAAAKSSAGFDGREGWEIWLALFSVGERKRILSQEPVNP